MTTFKPGDRVLVSCISACGRCDCCREGVLNGKVQVGGSVAIVGVHGRKVALYQERPWSHNVTITTRLVDTVTIPMLLKTVQSKRIDAGQLITHHFKLDRILQAYETFGKASSTKALKVIIEACRRARAAARAARVARAGAGSTATGPRAGRGSCLPGP